MKKAKMSDEPWALALRCATIDKGYSMLIGCRYCFVMVMGSFQLKNAFSETGYPAFYQWEQSLKEMKWFCQPITILT